MSASSEDANMEIDAPAGSNTAAARGEPVPSQNTHTGAPPSCNEAGDQQDMDGRWNHLRKVLERGSPMCHPDFEPSPQWLDMLAQCRVLIVGAGGLGCELLKNMALMGFRTIDIIDMDTIDLSNLNRQFLFREKDINRPKAEVAAEFVNERIEGVKVTPHYKKIQDYDEDWYRQFQLVVCGLDSIVARRWINGMLHSLLDYDEDGNVDQTTIIPFIDGGTEGFKGNARVILPGVSSCIECGLDLFPPQVNFPLCTIASTPRLPEHCIEYVRVLQWPKDKPFGEKGPDGDNPDHIAWIFQQAQERAKQFNIQGVTFRLTQGVIKHIIPAVASTNAIIASICATEAFKLASTCYAPLNNYLVFNNTDGIYTYTYESERNPECPICSNKPQILTLPPTTTLKQFRQQLIESPRYQMRAPGLTTTTAEGKNKTLYMQSVASLEERLRPNLDMTLEELGISEGQEINVTDVTSPQCFIFKISFPKDIKDSRDDANGEN